MNNGLDLVLPDDCRHHSGKVEIVSNDDEAAWQEFGTARIPPRSFLGGAATRKEREIRELMGRHVVGASEGSYRVLALRIVVSVMEEEGAERWISIDANSDPEVTEAV